MALPTSVFSDTPYFRLPVKPDFLLLAGSIPFVQSLKKSEHCAQGGVFVSLYLDCFDIKGLAVEKNECALVFQRNEFREASRVVSALISVLAAPALLACDAIDLQTGLSGRASRSCSFDIDLNKDFKRQMNLPSFVSDCRNALFCSCIGPVGLSLEHLERLADVIYPVCSIDPDIYFPASVNPDFYFDRMRVTLIAN